MRPSSLLAVASRSTLPSETIETPPSFKTLQQNRSIQAWALIEAYRAYGYRRAAVNPLRAAPDALSMPELDPEAYGLSVNNDHLRLDVQVGGISRTLTLAEL